MKLYTGVKITDLGDDGSGNNTRTVKFTISPRLRNENNMLHGTVITLRSGYNAELQDMILDIGTGNFEENKLSQIYASGNYFTVGT